MNKTVGDLLREARNKKGLALQTIERSTGIATHNLLAIELDQFSLIDADKLGAYLETYAKEVDLPLATLKAAPGFPATPAPETAVAPAPIAVPQASYQQPSVPQPPVQNQPQVAPQPIVTEEKTVEQPAPVASSNLRRTANRSTKSGKKKSGGFFKLIFGLLLTAALVFAGFTLYKQYFADFLTKKETPASSEVSSSAPASSSTSSSSTAASSAASSAPATKLAVSGGGDGIDVAVTTSKKPVKVEISLSGAEESWVGISNSDLGGVTLNAENPKAVATLNEGTTQSLIELGITQGVSIKINDQVLDMSAITSTATSSINLNIQ